MATERAKRSTPTRQIELLSSNPQRKKILALLLCLSTSSNPIILLHFCTCAHFVIASSRAIPLPYLPLLTHTHARRAPYIQAKHPLSPGRPPQNKRKMKSPIALFAPILLVVLILIHIVAVADAGGHTTPGGTILDIGDCRSRYCPRNSLGTDTITTNTTTTTARPRPRPLRTVEELFGFGGGRNYNDNDDEEEGEEEEKK